MSLIFVLVLLTEELKGPWHDVSGFNIAVKRDTITTATLTKASIQVGLTYSSEVSFIIAVAESMAVPGRHDTGEVAESFISGSAGSRKRE